MNQEIKDPFEGTPIEEVFSDEEKQSAEFAYFKLRSSVQHIIQTVMLDQKVTMTDLAIKMNKGLSVLSKQLDGEANLTTKTISLIMHSLGDELKVSSEKYENIIQQGKAAPLYPPFFQQSEQPGSMLAVSWYMVVRDREDTVLPALKQNQCFENSQSIFSPQCQYFNQPNKGRVRI